MIRPHMTGSHPELATGPERAASLCGPWGLCRARGRSTRGARRDAPTAILTQRTGAPVGQAPQNHESHCAGRLWYTGAGRVRTPPAIPPRRRTMGRPHPPTQHRCTLPAPLPLTGPHRCHSRPLLRQNAENGPFRPARPRRSRSGSAPGRGDRARPPPPPPGTPDFGGGPRARHSHYLWLRQVCREKTGYGRGPSGRSSPGSCAARC